MAVPANAAATGAFYHVVMSGCYGGSRSSAVVLAAEAYLHRWLRTYERCVDLFLAPSEFRSRQIDCQWLVPPTASTSYPTSRHLPAEEELATDEGYILYFGRLSTEKGVYELLRAMVRLPHMPLIIAGDGPERPRLEALAKELNSEPGRLRGHGPRRRSCRDLSRGAVFRYFRPTPTRLWGSRFSSRTPGGVRLSLRTWARDVNLYSTVLPGFSISDGDREQLAHSIGFLFDRPDLIDKMGAAARQRLKANHDPDLHIDKMLALYDRLSTKGRFISFPAASPPSRPGACGLRSSEDAEWCRSTAALNPITNKLDMSWCGWGTT